MHAPNNRSGSKAADARLAELIAAVENGRPPEPARKPKVNVLTVAVLTKEVTRLDVDDLYALLETERSLPPSVVVRCHSQIRAMYSWALRKKIVETNPALSADPPRIKPTKLVIPTMDDVRAVREVAEPGFAAYVQLAATVSAPRGRSSPSGGKRSTSTPGPRPSPPP